MKSRSQFMLVLLLSLSFISSLPPSQANNFPNSISFIFRRRHVHIVNNLPTAIGLHCESGDDDLGFRTLQPNQSQMIRFRIDWLLKTHFTCHAQWEGRSKLFDAFIVKRDMDRCGGRCYWSVRDDGFYFSGDGTTWDREYTWP